MDPQVTKNKEEKGGNIRYAEGEKRSKMLAGRRPSFFMSRKVNQKRKPGFKNRNRWEEHFTLPVVGTKLPLSLAPPELFFGRLYGSTTGE